MIKRVLAGVGAIGLLLAASGVQAQDCTIGNWTGTALNLNVNITNANAGTPAEGVKRFAGPCGLKVPVAGEEAYLVDTNPAAETEFNVRFYFFLEKISSNVTIFQAEDSSNAPVITANYVHGSPGKIDVVLAGSPAQTLSVSGAQIEEWNSLEIQWSSLNTKTPKVILGNPRESVEATGDAVGASLSISRAELGAIGTVPSGAGSAIYFDDYDSRRESVPGRLCRGLTADEAERDALSLADVAAIFNEVASFGTSRAPGQPDFDGDGLVTLADVSGVFSRVANFQSSCALNR